MGLWRGLRRRKNGLISCDERKRERWIRGCRHRQECVVCSVAVARKQNTGFLMVIDLIEIYIEKK